MERVSKFMQNGNVPPILSTFHGKTLMEYNFKEQISLAPETITDAQPYELSYEEQNAVRYMYVVRYIIKNVRRHLTIPKDDELLLALKDLCNTYNDTQPADSALWIEVG
jgi:hypothetical protein